MKSQFIAELRVGDKVSGSFAVTSKQLLSFSARSSRAGQEYMKVGLKDSSGVIDGFVWEDALAYYPLFEIDDIVFIEGLVSQFNGLQITINNIKRVSLEKVDISDYLPPAPVDVLALKKDLFHYISSLKQPILKVLLQKIFSGKLLESFCFCPGAKTIHHAYCGGLLKHTLEVAAIAQTFSSIYGNLDHDILTAGALLHDIGKVREYDLTSVSLRYSDKGQLCGHLILGRDILLEYASGIKGFPEGLMEELGHMILSHHGQREWGSPEVPKTLEAFALFHADLSSARLDQASVLLGSVRKTGTWSAWDKLLERSFYSPERNYSSQGSETAASFDDELF